MIRSSGQDADQFPSPGSPLVLTCRVCVTINTIFRTTNIRLFSSFGTWKTNKRNPALLQPQHSLLCLYPAFSLAGEGRREHSYFPFLKRPPRVSVLVQACFLVCMFTMFLFINSKARTDVFYEPQLLNETECSSVYSLHVSEGLTPNIQEPTSGNLSQSPVLKTAFFSQPQPRVPHGGLFSSLSH